LRAKGSGCYIDAKIEGFMPIQLVEDSVVAGRFRLNKMIGRGGMGSVWQATHLGLDIPCAVKFMEGEFSKSSEAQARFEREAKAAAQLRSPHVVQVLDHGVCEGTPYIAMELLDGEDLGKRLQRLGKIHPRDLNVIITQVCRALTKAHTVQIVHRDLKPDNIFLVHDDDREIAKVLDFGIAKSGAAALEGSNTKTGAMLGTPYYMSPEQAQGIKTVDYRSDLWSLGVIVYQCMTGLLPFESEALGDLLMKIIVQPLPVPSQVAEVAPGFDRWWARASQRDPAGRFQSAKEFAESLQMVFGASQVTDVMDRAMLKGVLGSTPQPGGPNALMLTPSGPQMAPPGFAPNAFAATTGAPIARTFNEGDASPAPPKKSNGLVIGIASAAVVVALSAVGVLAMRGKSAPSAASPPVLPAETAQAAPPPVVPAPAAAPAPAPSPVAAAVTTATALELPATTPTPAPAPPKESSHHHSSVDTSKAAAKPAPAAPAAGKPAAKAPGDLGF
jgi:serine/threonine protein kinase